MPNTPSARLLRSEVPVSETWKLEDLFATPEDWEKELQAVQDDLPTIAKYKGKLGEGAQTLLECLTAYEALVGRLIRVNTYANLHLQTDGTDPTNQSNAAKAGAAAASISAQLSFIESEILALPDDTMEQFLKEKPRLKEFAVLLRDLLETKPYRLHPETEEVVAALGEVFDAPYMIYQRSKSSDMEFDPISTDDEKELPMSFALYEEKYETHPNTTLRRKAYDSFVNTLKKYKNTYAAVYATEIKKQVTLAKLRGYSSVTEMLLQPQHVTLEMYNNLHDIIQTELAPHMRRLVNLKKKVLRLDEVFFCDLKAPLDPDFEPETTYEEAGQTILEALKVLGPEYNTIMQQALTERWVDRADNVGKSTGAFCSSPYGSHPFILMTWTDSMGSAFTLAHEMGHAGHFALANKHQRLSNVRPSRYFVEAPSTMHERLLSQYIIEKSSDPRMRRWVILQSLGTYYHNYVTHMLEAELQRRIYKLAEQGKPITANVLCDTKGQVLADFWGDVLTLDEGATLTWMRQPHYYMGLYPYTYSAGLTASTVCAQQIAEEGQPAVNRWLEVLKAGGTMRPLELMKHAGVDMSKPDPIRQAVAFVGSLIDELEASF